MTESFTCPECERTSYNRHDVEARYCGACHRFFPKEAETEDLPDDD